MFKYIEEETNVTNDEDYNDLHQDSLKLSFDHVFIVCWYLKYSIVLCMILLLLTMQA